jgi:hypothetical protein
MEVFQKPTLSHTSYPAQISVSRSDQAMSLNFNGIHSKRRLFLTLKNTFQGQKGVLRFVFDVTKIEFLTGLSL